MGELQSSSQKGISSVVAKKRLAQYGLNELKAAKKRSPILIFLSQFNSFFIYILLFAVVISIISGEAVDAIVILTILLFNAIFGFVQEFKAEKALDALKKLSGFSILAIRNGKKVEIDTKDLVPGDIIILSEGNKVPADCRLLEVSGLAVSEASLTGESVPVNKHANVIKGKVPLADRKNMVFSGTGVAKGKATAIVISTGMDTQIGKIAHLLSEQETSQTPLQQQLESLGKKIGIGTIIICILVFLVGTFKDGLYSIIGTQGFLAFVVASKEWFLTAVSLAVAAVPEGLPAIVTIALALGVRKMVSRHALIRRLPSVETLGETTVICSDKTGTLTCNEMTVREAWTMGSSLTFEGLGYSREGKVDGKVGKDEQLLMRIGVICNDAELLGKKITGDPTEAALLASAGKLGIMYEKLRKSCKIVKTEPFDSIRKMMSVACKDAGKTFVYTKGATEKLLLKCTHLLVKGKRVKLTAAMKRKILAKNEGMAHKALRVLGFAYKSYSSGELEKGLTFVGLQGMIDPPHSEVRSSIAKCHTAGIRVIMITGDNRITAQAIAKEIGILGKGMDGEEFAALNSKAKRQAIKEVSVFARVEPAHKMEIVDMLKKRGEIVAMTGDGVNDAPAIKKADLGIAMGITGTDVAKEASDMVLENDNFTTIVDAIEQGRGIYANITKFVNYLLSCNLAEIFVIFSAIVVGLPLPMTAVMLLWLNLVTDGLPALALSVDPHPKDLMQRKPRGAKDAIMNRSMAFNTVFVAILISVAVLGLFIWGKGRYEVMHMQTLAFSAMMITEMVWLQAIRREYNQSFFSNKWLVIAVGASVCLQLMVIYTPLNTYFGTTPLPLIDWVAIVGASFGVWVLFKSGEWVKNKMGWFAA